MNFSPDPGNRVGGWASRIREFWFARRRTILPVSIIVLSSFAIVKLVTEFYRLLLEPGKTGAIDLFLFHNMVNRWFAGVPLYGSTRYATYPPASLAILWPLLGWGEAATLRWFWAATTIIALSLTAVLMVRESRASEKAEMVLVVLLLLSMNATGVTVGNAQLTTHILPALVLATLVLHRRKPGLPGDLAAAALLVIALAKPSISAPFVILVLIGFGRVRVVALMAVGYAALTAFALTFQPTGPLTLIEGWMTRSFAVGTSGSGYGNLLSWLAGLGQTAWIFPVTLLVLAVFAVWLWQNRGVDFWILLGVTGIVARLWTHHRVYDDLLIILPTIALFRIAKKGPARDGSDVIAGLLLAATAASMLVPASVLQPPFPWTRPFTTTHVALWLAALVFLVYQAWKERHALTLPGAHAPGK